MKVSTVCYLMMDDYYIMMLRNKKEDDPNKDKWIGLGGKCEENESPVECIIREVKEEAGITVNSVKLRGIVTFISEKFETEVMFVYSSDNFTGILKQSDEGTIYKIKKSNILSLNLWEGDRIFVEKLLKNEDFFNVTLKYDSEDRLADSFVEVTEEEAVRAKYATIVSMLKEKGLHAASMESITGGLIASLITDNEGSSDVFYGGMTTYSTGAKIKYGVNPQTISEKSVYSKEVALEMACAVKADFASDIGIGTTGTAGNPDPMYPETSKCGEVYAAVVAGTQSKAVKLDIPYKNISRNFMKLKIAEAVADMITELCL